MYEDLKYLIAYLPIILCFTGLEVGGFWAYSTICFAFGLVPLLELFTPNRHVNLSADVLDNRSGNLFFDVLLYSHVPILYVLLFVFFTNVRQETYTPAALVGNVFSVGIILGTYGINVGHELGHRLNRIEPFLARMLLLPSHYIHFQIDHNLGHHKNVGTPEDASSAPRGMSVYRFWIRSVIGSYFSAWRIEANRLKRSGKAIISWENKMIQYTLAQIIYAALVLILFGFKALLLSFAVAIIGFLLLESVNYIEHYGLRRKKLANGRYEPVGHRHSWNSDHDLGRIILYELTRHTDHHMKSQKKYQTLEYVNDSPQLPFGYPGSILMSLIPPLWYNHIHPVLNELQHDSTNSN